MLNTGAHLKGQKKFYISLTKRLYQELILIPAFATDIERKDINNTVLDCLSYEEKLSAHSFKIPLNKN